MTIEKQSTSKKGGYRVGSGRVAGRPNKVTQQFRESISILLEQNAENYSRWLSQVAADDPAKALDLITRLAEYAAPKLSRTEYVGDPDSPLAVNASLKVTFD